MLFRSLCLSARTAHARLLLMDPSALRWGTACICSVLGLIVSCAMSGCTGSGEAKSITAYCGGSGVRSGAVEKLIDAEHLAGRFDGVALVD
ncbi:MAG: hypothetical protein NTV94_04980 [Planctomycetota bacterium]|nr:hypothetical protein [Planctomycetota bacterium]